MRRISKSIRWASLVLAATLTCATLPGFAQGAKLQLDNLEKLNNKAAEVNDVTLDGALLELAAKFIQADHDPDAKQLREVMQGLKGIYIKNFEFDEPDQYSQADVEAIRAQLSAPGWSRIVESRSRRAREHDEIYVLKQGDKIAGWAILVAEPRELTVVNIVGALDLNKLGLLEGHFGIPSGDEADDRHKRKHKNNDARPASDKNDKEKDHGPGDAATTEEDSDDNL